jgi:hypothetical protein
MDCRRGTWTPSGWWVVGGGWWVVGGGWGVGAAQAAQASCGRQHAPWPAWPDIPCPDMHACCKALQMLLLHCWWHHLQQCADLPASLRSCALLAACGGTCACAKPVALWPRADHHTQHPATEAFRLTARCRPAWCTLATSGVAMPCAAALPEPTCQGPPARAHLEHLLGKLPRAVHYQQQVGGRQAVASTWACLPAALAADALISAARCLLLPCCCPCLPRRCCEASMLLQGEHMGCCSGRLLDVYAACEGRAQHVLSKHAAHLSGGGAAVVRSRALLRVLPRCSGWASSWLGRADQGWNGTCNLCLSGTSLSAAACTASFLSSSMHCSSPGTVAHGDVHQQARVGGARLWRAQAGSAGQQQQLRQVAQGSSSSSSGR